MKGRIEIVMNQRESLILRLLLGLWLFGAVSARAVDDYPSKPIHIIVPFSAGSTADVRTRQVAQHLAEKFAQTVIVDNKPGASGNIGTKIAAGSPPDGYTLAYISNPRAIMPHLNRNLGFDVTKDFSPIALMANIAAVLVVNPGIPANSVKELVALAKSRPDLLSYGSSGLSLIHI